MNDAFDKLSLPIQKWIQGKNWQDLREIQKQAIHVIKDSDSDLIISAPTAGGKTEAVFFPLLSQIIEDNSASSSFDILYIAPLKALINDQFRRLDEICSNMDIPILPWHGDSSNTKKTKALTNPSGILLITPEALEAMFVLRGSEISKLFYGVRAAIIDELHSIIDSERGVQVRSLLFRLEQALKRNVRKIGLSATLGEISLACKFLRQENSDAVAIIEDSTGDSDLKLQLRGYIDSIDSIDSEETISALSSISQHIFSHIRGSNNLVFGGSKQNVELISDSLAELCQENGLPQEFYPHHANLTREHREFVENRLRGENKPTTAICTTTLELGIDIGSVKNVAQIGAPFNVSSLRQRLGRSGRREGEAAILRQYVYEPTINPNSNFSEKLRLRTIRSIAIIELLLEKWCEPPRPNALHLSTLVQQILSVIAERNGANAQTLYKILCKRGAFQQVSTKIFTDVLRCIGDKEVDLIEQTKTGLLLLGAKGERLVSHFSFYATFQTTEEYRLIADGKELGTIPISNIVIPGIMIIFSGRRWMVEEVQDKDRVIVVVPSNVGFPPKFGTDPGIVHDKIVEKMFELLENDVQPIYLDQIASELLGEARENYRQMKFSKGWISSNGPDEWLVATRCGSIKATTLALALKSFGFNIQVFDGFMEIISKNASLSLIEALELLTTNHKFNIFADNPNLQSEKYHRYLNKFLLQQDALSSRLDLGSLKSLCKKILGLTNQDG